MAWSLLDPSRIPATIPSGTDTSNETAKPPTSRRTVGPTDSPMMSATGRFDLSESPKSPVIASPTQFKYWRGIDSSRS